MTTTTEKPKHKKISGQQPAISDEGARKMALIIKYFMKLDSPSGRDSDRSRILELRDDPEVRQYMDEMDKAKLLEFH